MRKFSKYLVRRYVSRQRLYILAVLTSCFIILIDFTTLSIKESEVMGKGEKDPYSEVESSQSIDKEGTEIELAEDGDNAGSTLDDETITDEYRGIGLAISKVE